MGRDRAAYMRDYRKRRIETAYELGRVRATEGEIGVAGRALDALTENSLADDWQRIAEHLSIENKRLTDEVRHLKAELASRPLSPYTEVSSLSSDASRRAAQAQRDAILHKINRGG